MGLGTNRDYVTRDRAIKNTLKKKGLLKLWSCPNCSRKQYAGNKECPRCKTSRPNNVVYEILK